MPTPSWTVSFTMPTASNSPAKACAGHEANRTRRLDQPPSPVTQIHRPARLATRAASFRYGGRHHSGIPGDIIPLYPGDFVGIRTYRYRDRFGVAQTEATDDGQTQRGVRGQQRSNHDRRDCRVAECKADNSAEQQGQNCCDDAKSDGPVTRAPEKCE